MNATTLNTQAESTTVNEAHLITPAAIVPPTKLYRVEELAEAAGISLSYVYALISRNKPHVYARAGRSHLFGQEFLDSIKTMQPRRFRRQTVKVIADKRASHSDQHQYARAPVETKPQETHTNTLLQRIDMLERKVVELSSFLGV